MVYSHSLKVSPTKLGLGIMNMFAVHHVDEAGLQSALAEAHRLLKVQGCLMVALLGGDRAPGGGGKPPI